MSAIAERKALEGVSRAWRKLVAGAKASPPAAPPEGAPPTPETPVLPALAGPGGPSPPKKAGVATLPGD